MSATLGYIPNSDADRDIWLGNFSAKVGVQGPALGLTAAEITSVQKDAAFFHYILQLHELHKQTLNQVTSYKELLKKAVGQQHLPAIPSVPALASPPPAVPEGIFDRISKLVKRIKASANYSEAVGQDLGIIAAEQLIDVNALQPDLTVRLEAGVPRIKCIKGIADAIDLYVDRRDGSGFVIIARLPIPDYMDTATLPANVLLAEWDYRARYVIGNTPAGLMSPTVSVIVKRV